MGGRLASILLAVANSRIAGYMGLCGYAFESISFAQVFQDRRTVAAGKLRLSLQVSQDIVQMIAPVFQRLRQRLDLLGAVFLIRRRGGLTHAVRRVGIGRRRSTRTARSMVSGY